MPELSSPPSTCSGYILFASEGKPRSDHADHAHENGPLMTYPLVILAVLSVIGGYHAIFPETLTAFLLPDLLKVSTLPNHMWMVVLGTFAWICGLLISSTLYSKITDQDPVESRFPTFFKLCSSKLFFDEIYNFYISRIQDPMDQVSRGFRATFYFWAYGERICRCYCTSIIACQV